MKYTVIYQNQYALFSTVVDAFISKFMSKSDYEKWCKYQYEGIKFSEHVSDTLDEEIFSMRLNRTHEETLESLKETELSEEECSKLLYKMEEKHYTPILENGEYKCPNCGSIIEKNQKQCFNETCKLNFIWN